MKNFVRCPSKIHNPSTSHHNILNHRLLYWKENFEVAVLRKSRAVSFCWHKAKEGRCRSQAVHRAASSSKAGQQQGGEQQGGEQQGGEQLM